MTRRAMPLVAAALVLVACAPAAPAPEADAAPTDLDRLLERLEDTHPEPFHGVDREAWVADLREVEQQLPTLTEAESVVSVMRLVARLSAEGRDGHQFALPQAGHEGTVLPLRVYELDGGLVVTAAMDPYAALVGGRIEALDGTPVAEVLDLVEPLVPRDGPATVPTFRPIFTVRSQVLQGLGITDDDTVTLTVDGEDAAVEAVPFAEHATWAGRFGEFRLPELPGVGYRSRYGDVQRSRWLGDALHVRLTEIQETPSARTLRRLDDPRLRRVVLDLRQNPGGDNTHNLPWVTALDEAPLVVLTDRVTFSAAANLATDLEQTIDPVFVGEAMGGGLNFWDDVAPVRLDDLPVPMQVGVSTRYWQRAAADDPRLTIEPDVPVEVTAADVLAGRDPALRAALQVPLG